MLPAAGFAARATAGSVHGVRLESTHTVDASDAHSIRLLG
jgi:hypothetical protein